MEGGPKAEGFSGCKGSWVQSYRLVVSPASGTSQATLGASECGS